MSLYITVMVTFYIHVQSESGHSGQSAALERK